MGIIRGGYYYVDEHDEGTCDDDTLGIARALAEDKLAPKPKRQESTPLETQKKETTPESYESTRSAIQAAGYIIYCTYSSSPKKQADWMAERRKPESFENSHEEFIWHYGEQKSIQNVTEANLPCEVLYNAKTQRWEVYIKAKVFYKSQIEATEREENLRTEERSMGDLPSWERYKNEKRREPIKRVRDIGKTLTAAGTAALVDNKYNYAPVATIAGEDLQKLEELAGILKAAGIQCIATYKAEASEDEGNESKTGCYGIFVPRNIDKARVVQILAGSQIAQAVKKDVAKTIAVTSVPPFKINELLREITNPGDEIIDATQDTSSEAIAKLQSEGQKLGSYTNTVVHNVTATPRELGSRFNHGSSIKVYRLNDGNIQDIKTLKSKYRAAGRHFAFVVKISEENGNQKYLIDCWVTPRPQSAPTTRQKPQQPRRQQRGSGWSGGGFGGGFGGGWEY